MEIKILGTGCPKCDQLDKMTRQVVLETGIEASVFKVEDLREIMRSGVITTPALMIDSRVVLKGRVPTIEELNKLLTR